MVSSSFGYKLVEAAIELVKIKSIAHAKDFLLREMRMYNLVYWEQLALADRFNKELERYQKVKIAPIVKPMRKKRSKAKSQ